jgi:hypothetical protein
MKKGWFHLFGMGVRLLFLVGVIVTVFCEGMHAGAGFQCPYSFMLNNHYKGFVFILLNNYTKQCNQIVFFLQFKYIQQRQYNKIESQNY